MAAPVSVPAVGDSVTTTPQGALDLLESLTDCVVQIQVQVTTPDSALQHAIVIPPATQQERVAVLMLQDGETIEVAGVPESAAVTGVLVASDFGPRPGLSGEGISVAPDTIDHLLSSDDSERRRGAMALLAAAPDCWQSWAEDIGGGRWRLTHMTASWRDGRSGPGFDVLTLLDTPAGLCDVSLDGEQARLTPTTATAVWVRLSELSDRWLPTPAEGAL